MKLKQIRQQDLKVGDIARSLLLDSSSYEIVSITKDALTGLNIIGYKEICKDADEKEYTMLHYQHTYNEIWYLEVPSLWDRIVKFFKGK